jgi:hypothetical protein
MTRHQQPEQTRFESLWNLFNNTFEAQYGQQRWQSTLLPALRQPTRYACLINPFADACVVAEYLNQKLDDAERVKQLSFIHVPCLSLPYDPAVEYPFPSPIKDFQVCKISLISSLVTDKEN